MSNELLRALEASGGHARLNELCDMTHMHEDTVKNYLEMLKRDNKVAFCGLCTNAVCCDYTDS